MMMMGSKDAFDPGILKNISIIRKHILKGEQSIMGNYVSIETAVAEASAALGCRVTQIPGKKIMFQGTDSYGRKFILVTPQAKRQDKGFFWSDLTEVQYNLLDSAYSAVIVYRKEGGGTTTVDWSGLRNYLTRACMKYNANEGNHWKLYIYPGYIKIVGNDETLPLVSSTRSRKDIIRGVINS